MNIRDITKAALRSDSPLLPNGAKSVHYGEIDAPQVELALKEPEVLLKAAGIKVPEGVPIQVSTMAKAQAKSRLAARGVTIIVIIGDDFIIVIIIH
jgi:hypothetical protein